MTIVKVNYTKQRETYIQGMLGPLMVGQYSSCEASQACSDGSGKICCKTLITRRNTRHNVQQGDVVNSNKVLPVNSQHPSAHLLIAKDDGQRDDDKVSGASNVLEDEEDEDGVGVVALGQEDGSEMAAGCDEAEKVNQSEMGASITSNSEKGVRFNPGADQVENIPGCHCQGAKDKWDDHDNQGEDLVREVGRGVEDPAEGDVDVPGDDDHDDDDAYDDIPGDEHHHHHHHHHKLVTTTILLEFDSGFTR